MPRRDPLLAREGLRAALRVLSSSRSSSELFFLLQEWYDHLPAEYSPLPTASELMVFPHIWVHPPSYAAALQIHSLARVLVILHRPSSGGLDDYRSAQKLLILSVNTIRGIA